MNTNAISLGSLALRSALSVAGIAFSVGTALGLSACWGPPQIAPEGLIQMKACVDNINKGDYDAAETRCELCLEYNENTPECLNGLGLIWYARGVDDKARDYYKKAIRQNNDFAQARNNMGVLEFENENFEEASIYFNASIEIDPRYLDGRYNLALSYLRLGVNSYINKRPEYASWFEKAETQYRRLFELYPDYVKSYHDMGVVMTYRAEAETIEKRRRDYINDAESYFQRCLSLDTTHETCHENLAHLYLGIGRSDEALFHDVQCLAANKKNPQCADDLKRAYAGSQMQGEALKKYMDQIVENPGYAPSHYGFCLALFDKGLVEMAVTECENTLKLDNSLCLASYQLGQHYKRVLDKEQAIYHCRSLIACAGDTKYEAEVAECKEIVRALEVQ